MANDTQLMTKNMNMPSLCNFLIINFAEMKNVSCYIDLAFCLIVLPIMALIFPIERWFHNFPMFIASVTIWLYGLYILNRTVTVPYLFDKGRKKYIGICFIAVSIAITICLTSVNLYTPKPNIHDAGIARLFPKVQPYQQAIWSLFMIVEAFSFAVGLLTQANLQRMRRQEVEYERDKAEIALYKAQIKPHFMFNTLNSLYGLFLTHNENALVSLERFITMVRYVHHSSQLDMISLTDEIDYIKQYVELQSLRLNEMTTVSLVINVNDDNLTIPPMLLITFIENCFKHGVSSTEKSSIDIILQESDNKLLFTTSNRIFPNKRIGEHMGIENCRRRLALLFPGHHSLDVANDGTFFKVKLMIDFSND